MTNTAFTKPGEKAWLGCHVAPEPRPLVFRTMGRGHRKFKQAVFLLHVQPAVLYIHDKNYAAAIFCALLANCAHAHLMPHVTILNSHFLGGAKLRLECNTAKHVKKEQRQVNKKICELKGGNIGIVEKAQYCNNTVGYSYNI